MRLAVAVLALTLLGACTAPVGEQGPMGPRGEQGRPSLASYDGPRGRPGPEGPVEEPGERGPEGEAGPKGVAGPRGREGIQGPQGEQGPTGPAGGQGAPGPTGPEGTYVWRETILFDPEPEDVPICQDNETFLGRGVGHYRIYEPPEPIGGEVWCVAFTAPCPEGTSQAWFEAGLVTGYLFQDREWLENGDDYTGPLTEARYRGGGTERRPQREWMLLLNSTNQAGVMFEPDRIMLILDRSQPTRRDGSNVDDWQVHLTRLGPP